jgi:hypothetical protein
MHYRAIARRGARLVDDIVRQDAEAEVRDARHPCLQAAPTGVLLRAAKRWVGTCYYSWQAMAPGVVQPDSRTSDHEPRCVPDAECQQRPRKNEANVRQRPCPSLCVLEQVSPSTRRAGRAARQGEADVSWRLRYHGKWKLSRQISTEQRRCVQPPSAARWLSGTSLTAIAARRLRKTLHFGAFAASSPGRAHALGAHSCSWHSTRQRGRHVFPRHLGHSPAHWRRCTAAQPGRGCRGCTLRAGGGTLRQHFSACATGVR